MQKSRWNNAQGNECFAGREKKLRAIDAARRRKRIPRELKILQTEVKEYRGILNEVQSGDKRRLHTLLHQHKDFQLAYENHNPRVGLLCRESHRSI